MGATGATIYEQQPAVVLSQKMRIGQQERPLHDTMHSTTNIS